MAAAATSSRPRSSTGHVLLPAFDADHNRILVPVVTTRNLVSWTFGRGTVIWRIWPAVLLHTVFAAAVVSISLTTDIHLGIPNVLLTLLGVVIGFVISYRASSGYDRYWQGRSAWSDIARTSRTFSRLIWIHVPLKLVPTPVDANGKTPEVDVSIARRVMTEKRVALDLLEGFVVAVKHHLRGEMGIYYEDLYPFIKPLHNHTHHRRNAHSKPPAEAEVDIINVGTDADVIEVTSPEHDFHPELPPFVPVPPPTDAAPERPPPPSTHTSTSRTAHSAAGVVIPPVNAYDTLPPPLHTSHSFASSSSVSSENGERRPLLPGAVDAGAARRGVFGSVAVDLVPFWELWRGIGRIFGLRRAPQTVEDVERAATNGDDAEGWVDVYRDEDDPAGHSPPAHGRSRVPVTLVESATHDRLGATHTKHRPRVAGGGENLPLEIARALSVWLSVLDERGVVPGSALGGMFGCLAAFEDSLSTLERILTTPLPFVYSVHIRHTVWIYLFFLPFQLVDPFAWYTIPGVGMAAFIYLGLIAAGEEIEQPFGYDENDLDLDFFCRAIVHADIERVKRVSCPNVYLGSHHSPSASASASASAAPPPQAPGPHVSPPAHTHSAETIHAAHDLAVDAGTKVDVVFGGGRNL